MKEIKFNIQDFITEKCTLDKKEIKLIFDNYKFLTNENYLNKEPIIYEKYKNDNSSLVLDLNNRYSTG